MKKILFIDRDGTLIEEPSDHQVDRLDKVKFVKHVIPSLLSLSAKGYRFVMVSNQDGLGTKSFPSADFQPAQQLLLECFESQGITFDDIFICPHLPDDDCQCRKPRLGLVSSYLSSPDWDRSTSYVIGDRQSDELLAKHMGIEFIQIKQDDPLSWIRVQDRLLTLNRNSSVKRITKETSVEVQVNLDQQFSMAIHTGIPFFNHMLEQLATHSGISMNVQCQGDLAVDDHHSIEDVAICIGQAIKNALGDRVGIARYGFMLPMDESQASCTIDLSGRPHCRFNGSLLPRDLGGMHTEMVPHFFKSLAESLSAAIHLDVDGDNTHHMVEALFKALARCLGTAVTLTGTHLPSTKGVL